VQVSVEQVELGLPTAPLDGRLDFRWEQRQAAPHDRATAGLVARQGGPFQQRDVEPASREGERGGRPGGAGADDGDVEHVDH